MGVMDERHDIRDRADCERLVRAFYGKALEVGAKGYHEESTGVYTTR